jgi:hypothetical protein
MLRINPKCLMSSVLVAMLLDVSSGFAVAAEQRKSGSPSIASQANLGLDLGKVGQRVTGGAVHDMFPGASKPTENAPSSIMMDDNKGRIRQRGKSGMRSHTPPPPVIQAPVVVEPAPAPVEPVMPVVEAPPPPPPPIPTPPFPYKFIGAQRPTSGQAVYFLTKGNQLFTVGIGDVLEKEYTIDGEEAGQLTVTYLPLQRTQTISTGSQP